MKKIKWIILFVIILIIIVLVLLLIPRKTNNNKLNNSPKQQTNIETGELKSAEELGIVAPDTVNTKPEYIEFYTVSNCINQYLDTINSNNTAYFSRDNLSKISQDEINKKINALMSTNYNQTIQMLEEKNVFIPIEILSKTNGTVKSYAAYGILANTDMEYKEDAYFIVNLDTENKTYSIEPIVATMLSDIHVKELESIEKNDYNSFIYQKVDNEYNYKQIFNHIKRLMLTKPEKAYELLDKEYKEERFGSYEYFKKYVENNREHLIGITPKNYKTEENETILYIKDQYNNWYEFNISGTMEYTAKIDNYVVLNDNDLKKYAKYSEAEKIRYNINRWIKMINNKDYDTAYKFLDETFKNENYPTEEQFEDLLKQKYTSWYNNVEIDLKKDGNTYTAEVQLKVDEEEFSDKYITIYMQLTEDTDFTMSFKMN